MTAVHTESQHLTSYSRLVLSVLVLPLLFIAGVQLFILSEQTETYFAWTFASPLPAAFMGAGYWAAMLHAYSGVSTNNWAFVRTSMAGALTATTMLSITTFLHFDKFHLNSPLFITRFVTWVWIAVYVVVPPILAIAWMIQSRSLGAIAKGQNPLPSWMRGGFLFLSVFTLLSGVSLFLTPEAMNAIWPWAITPLAARAISSWLTAFGVACLTLALDNNLKFSTGTCASLFAFCVLELIVVARYASLIDWGKPLAIGYVLFLVLGLIITGWNLLGSKRLST